MRLRHFYRALDCAGFSSGHVLSERQREAAYALTMTGDAALITSADIAAALCVPLKVAAQVLLHLGAQGYGPVDMVAYCGDSVVACGDLWSIGDHCCNCGGRLTFDWRIRRGAPS